VLCFESLGKSEAIGKARLGWARVQIGSGRSLQTSQNKTQFESSSTLSIEIPLFLRSSYGLGLSGMRSSSNFRHSMVIIIDH
jgi:hypothetical protein